MGSRWMRVSALEHEHQRELWGYGASQFSCLSVKSAWACYRREATGKKMVAGAWEGPIGLRRVPREKGMLLLPLSPDSGEPVGWSPNWRPIVRALGWWHDYKAWENTQKGTRR